MTTGNGKTVTSLETPWFMRFTPRPQARFRLFCFPYAGGGATAYRTWGKEFPPEIEVCVVQYPGREGRLRETPFTRMPALIEALLPHIRRAAGQPFAFFGHSLGGLVAYELTRALCDGGYPMPAHLFVSARRAPHLPERNSPIHQLPHDAFIDELLTRYGGIPPVILQNKDLLQLYMPVLRADIELFETYVHAASTPLACPISAFGGREDRQALHDEIAAWQQMTSSAFRLRMLEGGHFFIQQRLSELVQAILDDLQWPQAVAAEAEATASK